MKPLHRTFYVFEFILAAHMVFSLIVEIQSVVFPVHILSEMLDNEPPWKKPKYPHANHNEVFDFISFFGFCMWLGLKYLFEGFRFNTLIVCAAELFFFLDRALQYADKVMCQVSAVLTIFYIYTLVTYPAYEFPQPTGPHKVGYRTLRVNDGFYSKVAIFYPTNDPVEAGLTDVQIKRLEKQIDWSPDNKYTKQIYEYLISRQWVPYPEWIIDFAIGHIYKRKFRCLLNADLLKVDDKVKKFPAIILSHGLSAHKHSYSTYAQQWASQGYIVYCVQHEELVYPWDDKNSKIFWKKNKPEMIQKYKKIRGAHLDWRVEQMQALLDMMTVKAKMSELFNCECEIDPACITVVGHSFGGSSALRMAQLDKRIKGIVAIDPWLFPMNKEVLTKPTQQDVPVLIVNQELEPQKDDLHDKNDMKALIEANSGASHFIAVKLKGMDHVHPTDLSFIIPSELQFSALIRDSDNIYLIQTSICRLVSLFINNYVQNKIESQSRSKLLIQPFNDWTKSAWKKVNTLIEIN